MEKHPALQTNNPQYVRQRIHSGGLSTLRALRRPYLVEWAGSSTTSQGEIKLLSKLSAIGAGIVPPVRASSARSQLANIGVSDKTAGVLIIGETGVCRQIRPDQNGRRTVG
jgi:hypothetical protein